MWLLSCVYQVVFLQVGELSKTLVAGLALERPFSTVHSQVDLGRNHRGELWGRDEACPLSFPEPGVYNAEASILGKTPS